MDKGKIIEQIEKLIVKYEKQNKNPVDTWDKDFTDGKIQGLKEALTITQN